MEFPQVVPKNSVSMPGMMKNILVLNHSFIVQHTKTHIIGPQGTA